MHELYFQCGKRVIDTLKIVALDGGVGTGKTKTLRDLIILIVQEGFAAIDSILVCCRNDTLTDQMAAFVLADIKSGISDDTVDAQIVNNIGDYFGIMIFMYY